MYASTRTSNRLLAAVCGFCFVLPSAAFAWLLARAVYLITLSENAAVYRSITVRGIALFFLITAGVCGLISFKLFEMAWRGFQVK